jgi:3-oxosteroid 1-dehydrogenase
MKRHQYLPQPFPLYSAAYDGCKGETIDLGLSVGGVLGKSGLDNALWFPSSLIKENDGSVSIFPHIVLDRSKPGLIAVNVKGKRFVNEAVSYHEFVRSMYKNTIEDPSIPAILICGKEFIWKYGFGLIRPKTPSLKKYIQKGYLYQANSLEDLAFKVGVDALALNQTISSFNSDVIKGRDREFFKGENIYDRSNGDPNNHPNPCLGLVTGPPFYAIKVYPTPLGTSLGLINNEFSQVLDCDGHPISGLYVAGNDMQSVMGGEYPGAGAQIGVAMTFGYVAAKHAAS